MEIVKDVVIFVFVFLNLQLVLLILKYLFFSIFCFLSGKLSNFLLTFIGFLTGILLIACVKKRFHCDVITINILTSVKLSLVFMVTIP